MKKLTPFAGKYGVDLAVFILRIVFGAFFITHGWPKLERIFAGNMAFGNPIGIGSDASLWLAGGIEVVGGALLILGLFMRWALIPMIFEMLVAAFIAHSSDPLVQRELPLMYLTVFAALWLLGPGKISLDARR